MRRAPVALRFAARELRGGLRGFGIFIACIALGVGAIGLLACAVARTYGVQRVCAVDINAARLEFARAHGFADAVLCLPPPTGERPKGADEQLKRAKDAADAALLAPRASMIAAPRLATVGM